MFNTVLSFIKGLISIFYNVKLEPPHSHLKYKCVAGVGGNSQQRRAARRRISRNKADWERHIDYQ